MTSVISTSARNLNFSSSSSSSSTFPGGGDGRLHDGPSSALNDVISDVLKRHHPPRCDNTKDQKINLNLEFLELKLLDVKNCDPKRLIPFFRSLNSAGGLLQVAQVTPSLTPSSADLVGSVKLRLQSRASSPVHFPSTSSGK